MLGTLQLKLPLKGTVSIKPGSPPFSFDRDQITAYQNGTAVDLSGNPTSGGEIRVVLKDVGGGCDVDANGSIFLGMQSFWNSVTLSADNTTLSWDMIATFDNSCRQVQDNVELDMVIDLPWCKVAKVFQRYLSTTIRYQISRTFRNFLAYW